MVKEFAYRGIAKEELENMSLEKLFQLFNARQRRSLTRGITDGKRKLIEEIKAAKAGKIKNPISFVWLFYWTLVVQWINTVFFFYDFYGH